MKFKANPIKGKGRGRRIGFPTINLKIPENFPLEEGIYACLVTLDGKEFRGALHFGPIPAFGEKDKSLEVFLLDVRDPNLLLEDEVAIDIKDKIRDILNFDNTEDLANQIDDDVKRIRLLLNS